MYVHSVNADKLEKHFSESENIWTIHAGVMIFQSSDSMKIYVTRHHETRIKSQTLKPHKMQNYVVLSK